MREMTQPPGQGKNAPLPCAEGRGLSTSGPSGNEDPVSSGEKAVNILDAVRSG